MGKHERQIAPRDVVVMRAELYRDGIVDTSEAALLLDLDHHATATCTEWDDFLAEEISDFLIYSQEPIGRIGEENADWLLDRIAPAGMVKTSRGLEVLVRTLEKVADAPSRLSAFALHQVAHAVLDGTGPANRVGGIAGIVERLDVQLIRRILLAAGNGGTAPITKAEADVLLEINDGPSRR